MNPSLPPNEILRSALREKKRLNPACTLRWFARKTGKSHAYWSRVLSGQKPFSPQHFDLVCEILELDEAARMNLRRAIVARTAEAAGPLPEHDVMAFLDRKFSPALSCYKDKVERDFSLHSRWYFIAILDLTTCENFVSDSQWIAERLGITPVQAEEAVKVLLRDGYLALDHGKLRKTENKLRFPTTQSKAMIRRYHKEMMQKAIHELENKQDEESFNRRLITGISIAANPKNLDRARQILLAAIHEAAAVLSEGECTELYQLNTQLFSVLAASPKAKKKAG